MNIQLVDAGVISALKALSVSENRSPESIISDLILEKCELRNIDPAELAGLRAQVARFEKNGLAYDGDEIIEWMLSWGTDNEKPEPQCRSYK